MRFNGKTVALCTLLVGLALAPFVHADSAADEKALKARADEFLAAWDKDDAKGLAAIFAPDGDLINPFGRVARGRAEVEKLFADEHATFTKGTHYNLTSLSTRLIGTDAAVQDWDIELTGMKGPDGSAMPPLKHHVTVVFEKKGGKWWALAARPAVPVPPPGPPAK
jgi:uncharacterized protein (TIGR02246 family)